ncbi:hypothetical protein A3B87_01465 [Candidatus Kuenenbacteria bacterium RIFCSPHIGHO2_02_FULL_39_13]|uniref:Uncharacterized protein n=1 Tax=Candidatus Kuenenbacteria bacterium RIFCSPHIGHO2_02_FULL_39_13 TaxID=1798561 RepID=A0A1F6FNT0_9BACT|nr:MAG: hypothetical protein A3B87_01465 [Candidatus Kuenenbacteria bacterium RIFCSPHIGHO2_02_FULL_39_13]
MTTQRANEIINEVCSELDAAIAKKNFRRIKYIYKHLNYEAIYSCDSVVYDNYYSIGEKLLLTLKENEAA